jgi:Protein of unknown function DUF262/Protein of unknown function (DUF1524)
MTSPFGETPLGLASEIMNLAAILTRRAALKVPRYQRPFTWTEKEVRRLIQDLRRAYERGATFYFIGQIVLVKNQRGELEISDGQQRLSTLTMIIAYVRDRLPHRAEHYQHLIMTMDHGRERPRLILREEDASFFRGFVQEPGKMIELSKLDEIGSDSKDNLSLAAGAIASELLEVSDREIDDFLAYVCRCATFNVVDADERGSAATVYNTVNDRGLELSAADNIKCDLLENSRLGDGEADAAARKWEELEDRLGRRHFSTLLNLMPFLLTGEQLISPGDLGAFRAQVERSGGVHAFLFDKLPRYCEALLEIFNGAVDVGLASADVNRRLKLMMQLDAWQWAPAALSFLAEHRGDADRAHRFFRALDRLAFASELSIVAPRNQEKRFARAAKFAGDDEQLFGQRGALELTDAEESKFIERLNHSPRKSRATRLLLMRLEAAMEDGSVLTLVDDATVEHILPRRGAPWWTERFPDRVLREDAANVLGNLLLITDRQNKEADNKSFPEKLNVYFNFPDAPIHALTRDIEGIGEWTLNAIGARQERLVRILCDDWDLAR